MSIEIFINVCIQSGEINAYSEWNHKLTTRVFMHLSNPGEVFRTADFGMTIWFIIYSFLELLFAWKTFHWLFKKEFTLSSSPLLKRIATAFSVFLIAGSTFFILLRGGIQPVPMNTDFACYSNDHVANDLSINSLYYFSKSFLLYNRSEIDEYMPKMDSVEASQIVKKMYAYPKEHANYIFDQKKPNYVFIVFEGWSGNAIDCMNDTKGITPNFDKLASQGLFFSNIFACGGTSEIGNSSIFSGYPALPEISLTMQPDKHRKIHTINQDLKMIGYSSNYLFSGDLKYGNIGSYFIDHGFDVVEDEKVFSIKLNRGKLNYFDQDLYSLLVKKTNKLKEPFLQCAFTGSTHSPYDHPKKKNQNYVGPEADYMNSLIYGDECLGNYMKQCRKQKWFKNTIFVFVSDHGHPSPACPDPSVKQYFRIPLLIWGEPLKKEYCGKKMEKIGSQADIAATILYQMGGDLSRYPWSKDLMNPHVPEFALHTINRGYGWVSNKGNLVYQMDTRTYRENTYKKEEEKQEIKKCHSFLTQFYKNYKSL
jgi:phosphoglycerol transferase MdoB-like AlkP superfamily enzyme